MMTLKLSAKGQITIPRHILSFHRWGKGKEFMIMDRGNEIVIKPVSEFPPSQLEPPDAPSVYKGKSLSLEDMENAISAEAGRHR